jgi:hypothetical protein
LRWAALASDVVSGAARGADGADEAAGLWRGKETMLVRGDFPYDVVGMGWERT